MQRETYRDEAVARHLNEHFISIKVDRELNPALDAYLIAFVTHTRDSSVV
ncbi:MAG: thioredoxin domain-containing protein [Gammaproteobacteria bacterium]|nr:thioredoxin domain-containing protein [Gammaproteobacteria bacterium]MCF6363309.1 thioredoxin domain-containing protein [Gammaproteobacteria bacterium]